MLERLSLHKQMTTRHRQIPSILPARGSLEPAVLSPVPPGPNGWLCFLVCIPSDLCLLVLTCVFLFIFTTLLNGFFAVRASKSSVEQSQP